jgi:thioredoxin reductase (NADPH)
VLIATGVSYRRLAVPDLDRLIGAGVYYGAASTEAASCSDKHIFIVGGGNSAGQSAMYLSKYARQVTLLVRRSGLSATMSQYLIDQISGTPNITVRPCTSVVGVAGVSHLESITIADATTGDQQICPADALFIFIGARPHTEWITDVVLRDSHGFLLAGSDLMSHDAAPAGWPLKRDPFWLETSVPGVFVAGDVRARSVKRVASAVGEGAMAVTFVHQHLANL